MGDEAEQGVLAAKEPGRKREARSRKLRGIIVLDANILFHSVAAVPDYFSSSRSEEERKTARLWDILLWLAQNGYQIIVPEMVAFEAADMLRGGKSIRPHLKTTRRKMSAIVFEFLQPAVLAGHVKIAQPPDNDMSASAYFIRSLANIHLGTGEKLKTFRTAQLLASSRMRNLGDQAARQWIVARTRRNENAVPLFYFSEDQGAQRAVHQLQIDNVYALTSINFFEALAEKCVFPWMGFKNKGADEWIKLIKKQEERTGMGGHFILDPEFMNIENRKIFADSLAGMSADFRNRNQSVLSLP